MKIRILIGPPVVSTSTATFTDYTSVLVERSWRISTKPRDVIDTIRFELHDPLINTTIHRGWDVVIEDFDNPSVRLFGGVITQVTIVSTGIERFLVFEAQDYTMLLDRKILRRTFETSGQDGRSIILDAFQNNTDNIDIGAGLDVISINDEIDLSNVQGSRTIDVMNFQGATLRSILSSVGQLTGYIWYLDYFKRLFFHPITFGAPISPIEFSDTPDEITTFLIYNASISQDLAEMNTVQVQGGTGVSVDIVQEVYAGDGSTTIFITGASQQSNRNPINRARVGQTIIEIDKNTGTDGTPVWTSQTVRLVDSDEAAGDVSWDPLQRRLEFASAPSNFTNGWRISGRFSFPTMVENHDYAAIARHKRQFWGSLVIPEVNDNRYARDLAMAFLRDNTDRDFIEFDTNKDGLNIGAISRITYTVFGYTNELILITGITTTIIGGETYQYHIQAEILKPVLFDPTKV